MIFETILKRGEKEKVRAGRVMTMSDKGPTIGQAPPGIYRTRSDLLIFFFKYIYIKGF